MERREFFHVKKSDTVHSNIGISSRCLWKSDGAVPNNDETPMEDMNDREGNWTPDVQDEQRGGTDLDGLDTEQNGNNGANGGVINDDNLNNDNDNMLRDENNRDQRNDDTNNR